MAPELLDGRRIAADRCLQRRGAPVPYFLTAVPGEGDSAHRIRIATRTGRRTPLGHRRPDLNPGFLQLIERALSAPPKRQATPTVLCAELEGFDSKAAPVAATRPDRGHRRGLRRRRRP